MKEMLSEVIRDIIHDELNNGGLDLSEREVHVIEQHLFSPKTLEEVAKEMGVTRERVRQVEFRAIRTIKCHFIQKNKTMASLKASNESLLEMVRELSNKHDGEGECASKEGALPLDYSIDYLGLSVRAYNCLRRAQINTIGELITKTQDELWRIRNMGKHSLEEIKERLERYGLRLREEEGY